MARRRGPSPKLFGSTDLTDFSVDLGFYQPAELLEAIRLARQFVFDLETTGLSPKKDRIEGIAFHIPAVGDLKKPVRAWYPFNPFTFMCHLPVSTVQAKWELWRSIGVDLDKLAEIIKGKEPHEIVLCDLRPPMDQEEVMEGLRPAWEEMENVISLAANRKFDDSFLYYASGTSMPIVMRGVLGDSMLADFASDERRMKYGLKTRVKQEFGHDMTTYTDAVRGSALLSFCDAKPLGVYAMDDCEWTWRLHEHALAQLRRQTPPKRGAVPTWTIEKTLGRPMGKLERIYWGIDCKISPIITEMETTGVLIDWRWLVQVEERITKEKEEIAARIEKYLGWPLNPNSGKQVGDALFAPPPDGLGLPMAGIPIGKTGDPSTSDKVIKHFGRFHPLVADVLKWRSLDTVETGFVKKLIKLATESPDGRIYSHFNMTRTVIGRLCVARDTPIEVVRDVAKHPAGIPIQDVKPGDLVYSYDDERRPVLRKVLNTWRTGYKKVIRIHWKSYNGSRSGHLDVTPDHPIRLIDGSYREAGALRSGDRLLALSRGHTGNGYARLYAAGNRTIPREHVFVYEQLNGALPAGHVVHHADHNKLNNVPDNLQSMAAGEHNRLHSVEMWEDAATRQSIVFALIRRWKEPGYKEAHSERMRQWWADGKYKKPSWRAHPQFKDIPKEWMEDSLWEAGGKVSVFAKKFGINHDRAKKFLADYGIDWKTIRLLHRDDGSLITREDIDRARQLTEREALKIVGKGYYKYRELQELYGFIDLHNHFVVSIEELPDPVDVYDLEIEGTHNFIAGEICVHNSSSDPINLQNQPREKNLVRKAYCAYREGVDEPDMLLLGGDFGQIELRVAAHLASEANMIEVYQMGGICAADAGQACARYKVWSCEASECGHSWTPEMWSAPKHAHACPKCGGTKTEHQARCRHVDLHQRTAEDARVKRNPLAKNLNFGLLFRMGAPKFCVYADLFDADGMPMVDFAKEVIERWHGAYPNIAPFHEITEYNLEKDNWIAETIFGRRRRLDQEMRVNRFRAVTQGIQFKVSGCVAPDTPILTETGYRRIDVLDPARDPIFDGEVFTQDYTVYRTGKKRLLRVVLSDGISVECSPDHRFMLKVDGGFQWTKAHDIRQGSGLLVVHNDGCPPEDPRSWRSIEQIDVTNDFVEMLDIEIHGKNHAYIANGVWSHNSAQDIMKAGMIRVVEERNKKIANSRPAERKLWEGFKLLMQIHDELVAQAHRDIAPEAQVLMKTAMEGVAKGHLKVPLVFDVKRGVNWDDVH